MAFVFTQRLSMNRGDAVVRALRRRLRLTAAERTNLRASRPPLALITASLGGRRNRNQLNCCRGWRNSNGRNR